MKEFRPAQKRIDVSVCESVRILRELQELSQSQLSGLTGIPQSNIYATENGRVNLGVERAETLARALKRSIVSGSFLCNYLMEPWNPGTTRRFSYRLHWRTMLARGAYDSSL